MLILLCGDYKSGKSVSASTFPKPMLWLDYDSGFKSVQSARDKVGQLITPDHDKIDVIPFIKEGYSDLSFSTQSGNVAKDSKYAEELVIKHNKIMKSLVVDGCYDGKGPYQTLVIDSLTTMFRVWKETILWVNKMSNLRVQDYGTLENQLFTKFFPSLKAIHEKIPNIILIDHIMMDKDEISGKILEFPVGPSKPTGKLMGVDVDDIWKMESKKGEYSWRTDGKIGLFQTGSRSSIPETIKPATYKRLMEVMK